MLFCKIEGASMIVSYEGRTYTHREKGIITPEKELIQINKTNVYFRGKFKNGIL